MDIAHDLVRVTIAHWSVDPAVVAARLPRGLELDTRDGQAWVGVGRS